MKKVTKLLLLIKRTKISFKYPSLSIKWQDQQAGHFKAYGSWQYARVADLDGKGIIPSENSQWSFQTLFRIFDKCS